MATEIGSITALIGTATATSLDGTVRNLQVGDKVFHNDIITTGAAGAIEIEFNDGNVMDMGRDSQAVLDLAVFDPDAPVAETAVADDVFDDIEAIQQALLEGEDPTLIADPAAAGPQGEGTSEGGSSTVVRDYLNPSMTPQNGFDTTGPEVNFIPLLEATFLDIPGGNGSTDVDEPGPGPDPVNTPPVADPILTNYQFASSTSAALPSNAFVFQQFTVGGGVDADEFGQSLPSVFESNPFFGGADVETDEANLIFTLTSLPDIGTMYKVEADGSFSELGLSGTFQVGDVIFWSAAKSELASYQFGGADGWSGVSLSAFNLDGSVGTISFTGDGIGVSGGTIVPNQLEYRDGNSQKIEASFNGPSTAAEIGVTRLIAGEREVGKVEAFLNGTSVGAWTFTTFAGSALLQSGEPVDFTLANGLLTVDPNGVAGNASFQLPDGVVFDELHFSAVEYLQGANLNTSDSSDYFISSIKVTELPSTELTYTTTDEDGLVSEPVVVIVSSQNLVSGPGEPGDGSTPDPSTFNPIVGTDSPRGDFLVGTDGNDIFTGKAGPDMFVWKDGHAGTEDTPAFDIVTDFSAAEGDVLDFSDLLQGEESGDITDFISVIESGDDILINLTPEGNGEMTQTVKLEGTSFNDLGIGGFDAATQQAQIIDTLISNGQINVDQS